MAKRHRWDADYVDDATLKEIEAELMADLDTCSPDDPPADTLAADEHVGLPNAQQGTPRPDRGDG